MVQRANHIRVSVYNTLQILLNGLSGTGHTLPVDFIPQLFQNDLDTTGLVEV